MTNRTDLTPIQLARKTPKGFDIEKMKSNAAVEALLQCDGNKTAAAKLLGVNRLTIIAWLARVGL
jgi:transcriptional regulator of acetoin/glycerol metabolism